MATMATPSSPSLFNLLLSFLLLLSTFYCANAQAPTLQQHQQQRNLQPQSQQTIQQQKYTQRQSAPDMNGGQDHRAHAVPGGAYTVYDHQGLGKAQVSLDGSGSHSHYYNPVKMIRGRIVSYRWQLVTANRTLCAKVRCTIRLPMGIYRVRLTVVDNTGDVASSTTRVHVADGGRPGIRVLYYKDVPNAPLFAPKLLKPDLSRTVSNVAFTNPSTFPNGVLGNMKKKKYTKALSIRVEMELDIKTTGRYSFRLHCEGAHCFAQIDRKGVFFPLGTGTRIKSRLLAEDRPYRMSIVWRRKANTKQLPKLVLQWIPPAKSNRPSALHVPIPSSYLSHRPGSIIPVVHFVTPQTTRVDTTLTLYGSSFIAPMKVILLPTMEECKNAKPLNQFMATCQLTGVSAGNRTVSVITNAGRSNSNARLIIVSDDVTKGLGYTQPIKFSDRTVSSYDKPGAPWKLSDPTSVKLGPDGRYYIGVQWGAIFVVQLFRDKILTACASQQLDNRAVLDVGFNPARPKSDDVYATLSTLFWQKNNASTWHNGEIGIFKRRVRSSDGAVCVYYSHALITGLPVSNYDHSVNKMAFDGYGRLYITVGSNTNAGVPSGEFGYLSDTYLSGTVLMAPVLKPGFNGKIKYSRYDDPAKAKKISGDVSIYAMGMRNSFGLLFHSNARLYATDNGGNQKFGPRSVGCNKEVTPENERDKLVLLKQGKFYGAANRVRGANDPRQCIHRRGGKDENLPGWEHPQRLLNAATTGITEYTMNTFGGKLKGDLFLTQLATSEANGQVLRAVLNKDDGTVARMYEFGERSGLAVALSPTGDLVMARVYRKHLLVSLAQESDPRILAVTSVNPFMGPRAGGYTITITGWGIQGDIKAKGLQVKVGGKPCSNVKRIDNKDGLTERQVQCTMPAATAGRQPLVGVVLSLANGATSKTLGNDFRYMSV